MGLALASFADVIDSLVLAIVDFLRSVAVRAIILFAIVGPVTFIVARVLQRRAQAEQDAPHPGISDETADSWAATLPADPDTTTISGSFDDR